MTGALSAAPVAGARARRAGLADDAGR